MVAKTPYSISHPPFQLEITNCDFKHRGNYTQKMALNPIYNFSWDPRKAAANIRKHGVTFPEAASVFADPLQLSNFDDANSEEEDRWVTIGISGSGRLLVVCHTFCVEETKGEFDIRIFSSRKATKHETAQYTGAK